MTSPATTMTPMIPMNKLATQLRHIGLRAFAR